MKRIAIDPSSTILGIVVFDESGRLEYWKTLDVSSVILYDRFSYVIAFIDTYVMEHPGKYRLVIEKPVPFAKCRVESMIVMARCIIAWAKLNKIDHAEYVPSKWKSVMLGNGHAGKEEARMVALRRFPHITMTTEHVYDAICLGLYDMIVG